MNKAILIGNLTKTPERKTTPNGTAVTTFSVAVQRRFKNAAGGYDTDFINCVAWRALADIISNNFDKGSKIALTGTIQTRSYEDKNGSKRYITEVVAEEIDFIEKKSKPQNNVPDADALFDDFAPVDDEDLPF